MHPRFISKKQMRAYALITKTPMRAYALITKTPRRLRPSNRGGCPRARRSQEALASDRGTSVLQSIGGRVGPLSAAKAAWPYPCSLVALGPMPGSHVCHAR